jgi:tetratricopeptide (TPR) repeat protein
MTVPLQKTPVTDPTADAARDWAPRRAQEARLQHLEELIACRGPACEPGESEIERAVLLAALDRRRDAQQAFVDILQKAPTNFSALNEFGTLLTDMGAIDAACRVYSEAILHHPQNPMGHVNIANLLLRANKYEQARGHYEAALRIDRNYAQAHQGLGAVLSDTGDRAGAVSFRKGLSRPRHFAPSLSGHQTARPVAPIGFIRRRQYPDRLVHGRQCFPDVGDRYRLSRSKAAAAAASIDLQCHR